MVASPRSLLAFLLLTGTTLGGESEPPKPKLDPQVVAAVKKVHDGMRRKREQQIKQVESGIKQARTREVQLQLRDRLEFLKTASMSLPIPTIGPPYRIDEIGKLTHDTFTVVSVADDRQFLGRLSYRSYRKYESQLAWLKGWDTSKLTTDSEVTVDGVVRITGVKAHTTVLGAENRLIVIEPFDLAPYLEPYKGVALVEEQPKPEPTPEQKTKQREKAAAVTLDMAKSFLEVGDKPTARKWLEAIIKDFSDTKAAKEARTLLEKL